MVLFLQNSRDIWLLTQGSYMSMLDNTGKAGRGVKIQTEAVVCFYLTKKIKRLLFSSIVFKECQKILTKTKNKMLTAETYTSMRLGH